MPRGLAPDVVSVQRSGYGLQLVTVRYPDGRESEGSGLTIQQAILKAQQRAEKGAAATA